MTDKYLTPFFVKLTMLMFALFWILIYISAEYSYQHAIVTPQGIADANAARQEIETWQLTVTPLPIFIGNISVSMVLIIPVIGFLLFLSVIVNTGNFIGLLAVAYNTSPIIYTLALFATPIGLLEFSAYAILAAESIYLTYLASRKLGVRDRIVKQSWKSLILYFLLLIIGALLEAVFIGIS